MRIAHKNLLIDINSEDSEFLGSMTFSTDREIAKRFFDAYDGDIPYDGDSELASFLDDEEQDSFQHFNADVFTAFLAWAMEEEDKINFDYYGKTFWLFHDISHAINDCVSGISTPSAHAENVANTYSIEQHAAHGLSIDLDYSDVEQYSDEFYQRFAESMEMEYSDLHPEAKELEGDTDTIQGYYGVSSSNNTEIFVCTMPDGTVWYATYGSTNVNSTMDEIEEGTNVETLSDNDTFSWGSPIESEEELLEAVND